MMLEVKCQLIWIIEAHFTEGLVKCMNVWPYAIQMDVSERTRWVQMCEENLETCAHFNNVETTPEQSCSRVCV